MYLVGTQGTVKGLTLTLEIDVVRMEAIMVEKLVVSEDANHGDALH